MKKQQSPRFVQLDNACVWLLSSDIYILMQTKTCFRLQGEHQFTLLAPGPHPNSFVALDRLLTWKIFVWVTSHAECLSTGTVLIQQSQKIDIVGIHFLPDLMVLTSNHGLYLCPRPSRISSIPTSESSHSTIALNAREYFSPNQSQISHLTSDFLWSDLLPGEGATLKATYSAGSCIFLAYYHFSSEGIYSFYELIIHKTGIKSGQRVFIDLGSAPIDLIDLSGDRLLLSTEKALFLLNPLSPPRKLDLQYTIRSPWSHDGKGWTAVAQYIPLHQLQTSGRMSQSQTGSQDAPPNQGKHTLTITISAKKNKQSQFEFQVQENQLGFPEIIQVSNGFGLTKRHELMNLKIGEILIANHTCSILDAKMVGGPHWNALVYRKKIGLDCLSSLMTAQMIAVSDQHYKNPYLFLDQSSLLCYLPSQATNNAPKKSHQTEDLPFKPPSYDLIFSNEFIGCLPVKLSFRDQIYLESSDLPLPKGTELLAYSPKLKITLDKILPLNAKEVVIQQLFEGAITQVSHALTFDTWFVLAVNEQIHVYNIADFTRLAIHVFDEQISSLYQLNDYNIFAVQRYADNSNDVFFFSDGELSKLEFSWRSSGNLFKCQIIVNLQPYKIGINQQVIVICPNTFFNKYQKGKIRIQVEEMPIKGLDGICPILGQSGPMWLAWGQGQITIISCSSKVLLKGGQKVSLEQTALIRVILNEDPIFCYYFERTLLLFGSQLISTYSLSSGNIIGEGSLKSWIDWQLRPESILPANLEHHKLVYVPNSSFGFLFNRYQLWYVKFEKQGTSKLSDDVIPLSSGRGFLKKISYFSVTNDAYMIVRNQVSMTDLSNEKFMNEFEMKLPILDLAYVDNKCIVVLYPEMLVILEIGYNQALILNHQIKFNDFHIIKLLGSCEAHSLYVKDDQARLLLLTPIDEIYQFVFVQYLDDQTVFIGKAHFWNLPKAIYPLGVHEQAKTYQKIQVKGDGQIIVSQTRSNKQTDRNERNLQLESERQYSPPEKISSGSARKSVYL